MRRLFPKIFLSILLAMVAAFVIGNAIASWAHPSRFLSGPPNEGPGRGPGRGPKPWAERRGFGGGAADGHFERMIESQRDIVEWLLMDKGRPAAIEYINEFGDPGHFEAYLIDARRNDIRGVEVPPDLAALSAKALSTHTLESADNPRWMMFAIRVQGPQNERYVFAVRIVKLLQVMARLHYWRFTLFVVTIFLTLLIVCYIVARYISKPVLKLRHAAQRFAQGDLEHRVLPEIGRRKDELGDLARDFDNMAERLAALLNAQRRLLRDISHELRSPLARQNVALELARTHCSPEGREALDRAEREVARLNELVGELLALTRLESDSQSIERTPLRLDTVLRSIVDDADFEARAAGRRVVLSDCEVCEVRGVESLLRRAIENVVRNGAAYTAEGTSVEVSLRVLDTTAILRVRDHGPGVPESELGHIFRAFYRVSHARERQTGGVGLGLAIADRAIAAHHGSVRASNVEDGGLLVELRIPIGS